MAKAFVSILSLLVSLTFLFCRSDRSKKDLFTTTQICDKRLFVETYIIIGGGAGGGDRVSAYLTDSSNFRKYIGTYVQLYKHYWYKCISDSIKIHEIDDQNENKIVSIKTYFLPDLQKEGKFE